MEVKIMFDPGLLLFKLPLHLQMEVKITFGPDLLLFKLPLHFLSSIEYNMFSRC